MAIQKKEKAGGKEFTLQHPGVRWQVQLQDRVIKSDKPTELYATEVLEHVVIEPTGLTIDSFDTYDELDELIAKIRTFLKTSK